MSIVQPHFRSLSVAVKWLQVPERAGLGREGGKGLAWLIGRAIQPHICQPESRVPCGHVQDVLAHLPVSHVICCQDVNGHDENICLLGRLQVFSKCLWEEGRERSHVTRSALMVLLVWAVQAALVRDAQQCW